MVLEAQTLARACGKSHLHNLEPEDLVALTAGGERDGPRAAGRDELDPRRLSENHPPGNLPFWTNLFTIRG